MDLISILPGLSILSSGFKLLRLFRVFRTFRVFRVFKAFRYSKSISIIMEVMKNSKEALLAVCALAIGYIMISSMFGIAIVALPAGIITAGYMEALSNEKEKEKP